MAEAEKEATPPEGEMPPEERSQPPAPSHGDEGPLGEAVAELFGKIWRRGRVEVEKAARRGRERLALRQMRGDRDRMYQKLGKEARQLVEGGDLDHPGLKKGVARIAELEARILEAE